MNARAPRLANREPLPWRKPGGGLMNACFALILLCAAGAESAEAALPVPRHLITADAPPLEAPDTLVQRYLEAVDRGELKLFGHTLSRAMIVPVRVEYAYELSERTTRIRIHANLKAPLPLPGQPDCRVLAVSAVMEDGQITEIESHVWIE
jgi:hypothetical protein